MKFKVGDKVILKEGLDEEIDEGFYKKDIVGKIGEIVEVAFNGGLYYIKYDELGFCCYICNHHFELYREPLSQEEVINGISEIQRSHRVENNQEYNKPSLEDKIENFLCENKIAYKKSIGHEFDKNGKCCKVVSAITHDYGTVEIVVTQNYN